jgi:uncharacterized phage protein (TIGR01671 family)
MREIKFRAWDLVTKTMKEVRGIFYFRGDELKMVNITENRRFEFMQFTGLKDSKGKEIYEGDIVRFYEQGYDPNEPDEERIEPETTTVLIYWNENGKCLAIDWDYEDSRFAPVGWGYEWILNSEFDYHEVIGNIYENPELLKEVENEFL